MGSLIYEVKNTFPEMSEQDNITYFLLVWLLDDKRSSYKTQV